MSNFSFRKHFDFFDINTSNFGGRRQCAFARLNAKPEPFVLHVVLIDSKFQSPGPPCSGTSWPWNLSLSLESCSKNFTKSECNTNINEELL